MSIRDFGKSLARGLSSMTPEQRAMLLRTAAATTNNPNARAGLAQQAQDIIALSEREKEAARKQAIEEMRQAQINQRAKEREEGRWARFYQGQQAPTAWQKDLGTAANILSNEDAPVWLKSAAREKLGIKEKDLPVWRQQYNEARRAVSDPNASESEKAWGTRFLYGSSTEFELGPDGTVKFRSGGSPTLTTSRRTELQGMVGTLEGAKEQLSDIVSFYGKNKQNIPSWSYGSAGDLTKKISGFFNQYNLPMSSWVEGTLNPKEAQELRTRSIALGTQLLPLFTGEEGRFTDTDRAIGYAAAQVMTDPDATPTSVAQAWKTVGDLLDKNLSRVQVELLQDQLDPDPEIRQIQIQLLNEGLSWNEIKRITEGG